MSVLEIISKLYDSVIFNIEKGIIFENWYLFFEIINYSCFLKCVWDIEVYLR